MKHFNAVADDPVCELLAAVCALVLVVTAPLWIVPYGAVKLLRKLKKLSYKKRIG
ncbi:MAG: hypothetical protein QM689_02425 [Oscillospiraceae bacterium]